MPTNQMGEFVKLRAMIEQTVFYLNLEARKEFTDAVQPAPSLDKVRQPYRQWITDPNTIPAAKQSEIRKPPARS